MNNSKTTDKEILLFAYKISRLVRQHVSDISHSTEEPSMLQLQVLKYISEDIVTMSQIAKELYIKLPTASSLVDRLIEAGYVKRINNVIDRRITKIKLTKKGVEILKKTMNSKMKKMKFILDKLTMNEKKSLISIMENLSLIHI